MSRHFIEAIKTILLLSALTAGQATLAEEYQSAQKASPEWRTPVIAEYGKVRPYPDAAAQLDPEQTYKVVFNVTKAAQDENDVVPGLESAARFVNLAGLAKVPGKNLELVAVLNGPATSAALGDDAYLKRHQRTNPNRKLIAALNEAGVDVMVCGQALAHKGFSTTEVANDVTVAVAALTVLAKYQSAGYALIPN